MAASDFRLPASMQRLLEGLRADVASLGQRLHTLLARQPRSGDITVQPQSPATTETQAFTVTHGAGYNPAAIQATVHGGALAQTLVPRVEKLSATQFKIRVESNATINFTVGVYWTVFAR